jgi:hypothetical protein
VPTRCAPPGSGSSGVTPQEKVRQKFAQDEADQKSRLYYGPKGAKRKEKCTKDVYDHMLGLGWPYADAQGLLYLKTHLPSLPIFPTGGNKNYFLRRLRIYKLIRYVMEKEGILAPTACSNLDQMMKALPVRLNKPKYTLMGDDCSWVDAVAKNIGVVGGTTSLMKIK